MKITRIEVFNLRFEYPNAHGFRYGGGVCSARVTTVVLAHTDTEHVGIGSCYTHPGLAHLILENQFAPLLIGKDPRAVEALWEWMYGLTRWYGRKGAAMSAIGALDMAFWDLRGKAESTPIYQMLGSDKNTCPAYASALLWDEPEAMAREAVGHVARGFKRMKMRLGQGEEKDLAAVRAVRTAIGDGVDLMVDAGMRLNVPLARRMAQTLEECGVFWFEEPFEPEDLESYAQLRGTIGVRLAAGENEFGVQGFRELIEKRAVDIVQPDASRCGGISQTWQVAKMASENDLGVATHTWSDAITVVANAHVVASCPTGITVEVDQTGNPFIEELLTTPLKIEHGELQLGSAPGLGIELNRAALEKYRMTDPLRVPNGNYSDMVWGAEYYAPAGEYQEIG